MSTAIEVYKYAGTQFAAGGSKPQACKCASLQIFISASRRRVHLRIAVPLAVRTCTFQPFLGPTPAMPAAIAYPPNGGRVVSALVKCCYVSGCLRPTFRQQGISASPQVCRCANRRIINHASRLAKYRYSCYDWYDHMNVEPFCPRLSACSMSFSSSLRFP